MAAVIMCASSVSLYWPDCRRRAVPAMSAMIDAASGSGRSTPRRESTRTASRSNCRSVSVAESRRAGSRVAARKIDSSSAATSGPRSANTWLTRLVASLRLNVASMSSSVRAARSAVHCWMWAASASRSRSSMDAK